MNLAIDRLSGASGLRADEIGSFLATHEFPLVEGPSITFVFRGEADEVNLRHWIYGLPSSQALERLAGSDFWFITVEVPPGSRIEYKFELIRGNRRRWVRDPFNPHLARDPFGANSVCHGEGYVRPDWTLRDPEARAGTLEELTLESEALDREERVSVYLPARLRWARRYPLLVVHDGLDFVRYAGLKVVLDNLIHRLEIPQMIVALTQSPDRLREYAANRAHARFVCEELLPLLQDRYPLLERPASRGLLGASFGAVAALSTAWYHPGVFGRLILQSGSFAFTDIGKSERGPAFEPVVRFVNELRRAPGKPADRLFVSCGTYESLIYENRSLVPLLQQAGLDVRFVEARDGHNWENWRDRLREGLSFCFPGPLWMVYE